MVGYVFNVEVRHRSNVREVQCMHVPTRGSFQKFEYKREWPGQVKLHHYGAAF